MTNTPSPRDRDSSEQDQFLTILSREDALARFEAALFPRAVPAETRPLADALGCALAEDVVAPIDVPPFDRSNVDGFAVRSADLAAAGEASPVRVMLNDEVIACGTAPTRPVLSGTATSIATGGPVPRGADAVVMVEHTQPAGHRAIEIRRAASPGQFVSYAGSDIARGEALLRAGTVIGSREIGMLAACGIAHITVARRPRVAIISTGDELVQPGQPLRPAAIYDTNGAIVTAAISENGGEAHFSARSRTTKPNSRSAMRKALETSDMLVLSGGTSKGAGDVSHRIIARLGKPGIIAHGVALKPGKPLCLAVCDGKPVIILPGFPTSAMFTFHDMIVPVLRRMARPAAAFGRQGRCTRTGADRLRTRPHRIRDGVAGRRGGWADRVPDRQGLRRHHLLCAGRRLSAHRCAGRSDAGRRASRGDAVHAACAGAGSRHRRQPLHRARSRHGAAGACGPCRALDCRRQPRRALGRQTRRVRFCADPFIRREDRNLQHALSQRRTRTGAGMAPHAGHRVPQRKTGASRA